MSKRIFTKEQIVDLLKNKNILKCSEKSITYNKKFKLLAIKLYNEGLGCPEIFCKAGFDLELIGNETPRACLKRWRRKHSDEGNLGLIRDKRGYSKNGGRPKTKGLTDTEQIKRLKIEVAYLKAENDFLAKLRANKKR